MAETSLGQRRQASRLDRHPQHPCQFLLQAGALPHRLVGGGHRDRATEGRFGRHAGVSDRDRLQLDAEIGEVGLVASGGIGPQRPFDELAIASTTTLENATLLLKVSLGEESLHWFDVIACGDIVSNKKPAPDIYLYTLDQLGLTAAQCLVIEDSGAGLASALAADLTTVVTVNGSTRHQDFSGAAIVLDQLGEPERGFEVLAGDAGGARLVDVAFLRSSHFKSGL